MPLRTQMNDAWADDAAGEIRRHLEGETPDEDEDEEDYEE